MTRYVLIDDNLKPCQQGAWVEYSEVEKLQARYMVLLEDYKNLEYELLGRFKHKIAQAKGILETFNWEVRE